MTRTASPELLSFDLGALSPGPHRVQWQSNSAGTVSGNLRWQWHTRDRLRKQSHGLKVVLETPKRLLHPGGHALMKVILENPSTETIAMPTLEIPVPPGLRVDRDFLEALKRRGRISRYEDLGTVLNIYLSKISGSEKIEIPYQLIAEAECRVNQRAVTAYAYYSPEIRGNSDTAILEVRSSSRTVATARLAPLQ